MSNETSIPDRLIQHAQLNSDATTVEAAGAVSPNPPRWLAELEDALEWSLDELRTDSPGFVGGGVE